MTQDVNILVTSAGRRVKLIACCRKTLEALGLSGRVFAIDADTSLSAACQLADAHYQCPRADDPAYIPFLEELCDRLDVDIVIPTIDTELLPLAAAKNDFLEHDVAIAVSDIDICEAFKLKTTTHAFFVEHGFPTLPIVEDLVNARYPLFARLNDSSRSVGAQRVNDVSEALKLREANPGYVFQPFVEADEYTADAFVDSKGTVIDVVPRRRLEVRDGEVSKAITVRDRRIVDEVVRLIRAMPGAYGVLTVQLFATGDELNFIEVNPRFGGGFPLAYHAGADMVAYLIRDFLGHKLTWQDTWQNSTLMLRYDDEVIQHGARL